MVRASDEIEPSILAKRASAQEAAVANECSCIFRGLWRCASARSRNNWEILRLIAA
jgi:hypothetical protein